MKALDVLGHRWPVLLWIAAEMLQLHLDLRLFLFYDGQASDLKSVAAAEDGLVRAEGVIDVAGLLYGWNGGNVFGQHAERAKKAAANGKQIGVGHVRVLPDSDSIWGSFKVCNTKTL